MKKLFLFCFLMLIAPLLKGQTEKVDCFCCTDTHKQFDFWIGTWEVFDTTGTKVGENVILPLQDHCTLQENWKSSNSTGSSYNYYNSTDKSWNQVWVDNRGNSLVLKGNLIKGKMVMRDVLSKNPKGILTYNQIIWQQHSDGTVSQTWEVFGEKNERLGLLFKGIYKKI